MSSALAEQEIVGGAFVGRGVVGLRLDLAERDMRLVQAAEPVDACEQFVGDAVHHLTVLAMHIGVQPAERGDAGGGAHAAEKAVALDQQRLAANAAADAAAAMPAGPPPSTTTSYSPRTGRSRSGSRIDFAVIGA